MCVAAVCLSLTFATPSSAAIANFFGWGYSQDEVYQEVQAWVDLAGNILGLVGVISPPAAELGAVIKTVSLVATVFDPPSEAILSGRLSLTFDPSEQVLAAGWYGEFGFDPLLPAPAIGEDDFFGSIEPLLQPDANPAMVSSSITIDQAAGTAVFEFDWGPSGMTPTLNLDAEGHFNVMGIYSATETGPAQGMQVVGSPAETQALGTASSTYMLCEGGYCGVVPEPGRSWLVACALLVLAGAWRGRARRLSSG